MADWKSRKGIKATMAAEKTARSLVRCMQRPKTVATSGRGLKNGRNASGPRATVTGARREGKSERLWADQIRPAWDTQDTNEEEGASGGREDIDDPGPTCSAWASRLAEWTAAQLKWCQSSNTSTPGEGISHQHVKVQQQQKQTMPAQERGFAEQMQPQTLVHGPSNWHPVRCQQEENAVMRGRFRPEISSP